MPKLYQHRQLEGDHQFRLLELLPTTSISDPVEVKIHHVRFDKHPKYAAISYTWDDQPFDSPLFYKDEKLMATKNCDLILRRLRPPFAYASVYIWIDQLCINQDSGLDKTINVSRMGAIYQQATTVLIWTGLYDKTVAEEIVSATEIHGDLGTTPYTITEHWTSLYGLVRQKTPRDAASTMASNSTADTSKPKKRRQDMTDTLHSFRTKFQKNPWFKRMWTFQEAIIPLNHRVYFIIGKWTVPLDILNDRNYGTANEFYVMRSTNTSRDFAGLLNTVRNRQCRDPRDKYFALYSVTCLMHQEPGHEFPVPDYNKNVKEVYTEAAQWALEERKEAGILYLATLSASELETTKPTATLPSWVPDPCRLSHLKRENRSTFFPGQKTPYHPVPKSTLTATITWERWFGREMMPVLSFRGRFVDEIDATSVEIPNAAMWEYSPDSYQQTLSSILQHIIFAGFELGYFDSGWIKGVQSFWKTLCYPSTADYRSTWQERCLRYMFAEKASLTEETKSIRRYRNLLKDTNGKSLPSNGIPPDFWPLRTQQTRPQLDGAQHSGTADQLFRILSNVEKHKIIITKHRRVGIVIGGVQRGDRVAIAPGFCKVLFLRRVGNRDSLVGHGYVDGMMEGQLWTDDPTNLNQIVLI
ncbi:hypothetical protein G7054_g6619 [Neopestalotiopsis clavispora]|nr:hypothetical protein G7054_g6619 [Neopestalotiopsis clavispora]